MRMKVNSNKVICPDFSRNFLDVYIDDETWVKVVKVVAPGIRKMAVRNVVFV